MPAKVMAAETVIGAVFTRENPPSEKEVEAMKEVKKFHDGAKLMVNGEKDEHGLPVAFIVHADKVVPVTPHPKHAGIVLRGGEERADGMVADDPVLHAHRVPVAQVVELIRAGVLAA